eukprot:scaffold18086_cov112-Isochrysis_galbana.AAC.3
MRSSKVTATALQPISIAGREAMDSTKGKIAAGSRCDRRRRRSSRAATASARLVEGEARSMRSFESFWSLDEAIASQTSLALDGSGMKAHMSDTSFAASSGADASARFALIARCSSTHLAAWPWAVRLARKREMNALRCRGCRSRWTMHSPFASNIVASTAGKLGSSLSCSSSSSSKRDSASRDASAP